MFSKKCVEETKHLLTKNKHLFERSDKLKSLSLNDYKIEHKTDWITQMNF